jgi:hypothetical protein
VNPLEYPLDELLYTHMLAIGKGVEIHGFGMADRDESGVLFVGQSGAGKTTIARLWEQEPGVRLLSDDRIIVRRIDGKFWMYGTPWHGDAGIADPGRARLEKLYFLRHGARNELNPLSSSEEVAQLFTCVFIPFYNRSAVDFTLGFLEIMTGNLPCYELSFIPDTSVIELLQSSYE